MNELDHSLLKRASRGSRESQRALYEHYAPMVWNVVFRTVNGDAHAAADVTQEVFYRVLRSLGKFNNNAGFSTWIYRIAFNASMSYLGRRARRRRRETTIDENGSGMGRDAGAGSRAEVREILGRLSPEERFLLVAREVEDLSFEQLAGITGKSAGALRTSLHRLKERIRKEERYE